MSKKNVRKKKQSFDEKRAAKKAAVLEAGEKKRKPLLFGIVTVGVVLLVIFGFTLFHKRGNTSQSFNKRGKALQSVSQANQIVHPVKLFEDGRARHFQLDTKDGLSIKYFVLKSADGIIRAAFDACDVCWASGKGYSQAGDDMVCRNCGKRFASVKVNEIRGGCNPAPLKRQVVGENLVIEVKDILEGWQYFDFTRRG